MRAALDRRTLLPLLVLVFLALSAPSPAAAEERIALVIGNGNYSEGALKNPVNDARDMASLLKSQGFQVTLKLNAGVKDMEESVRQFGLALRRGGVGLFYFAGHGLQVGGSNYLVPVDAKIVSESDVRFECVDAGRVLGKMEDAGNSLNIVILDACRNNPFARSFRSTERGLAEMRAPTGSIIAYATAPGSVAADGAGANGVYTKHLLKNMRTPGLSITDVFMRVRMGVVAETGKKQVPWESSSLTGYFYLSGQGQPGAPQPQAAQAVPAEPAAPTAFAAPTAPAVPAAPKLDPKAERKRLIEEAARLKREREELAQLNALQAEKDRLEAERQKIEQTKLAMASRPKQAPAVSKASTAANAPYFSLLARDGISEAQRYFETTVQARPDDADARAGLAIALMLTKRAADAKYHVRRVEESGVTTPGTRVARGLMLGLDGQQADSAYQLNRALEEGADSALVQLAMATAAAKKNEFEQAKKSLESYRSLVPDHEQGEYARDLMRKVDLKGRLVGTFYWTQENKAISAYSSTFTFVMTGDALTATAGGYTTGTISDIKVEAKTLTFRFHYSAGIFSGYYDFVCDLSGDLDTIPLTAKDSTFGSSWQGFLLRQGSLAQSMAYHMNPADCFIATAAYGEAWDARIDTLRRFRDSVMATNDLGRMLVATYYRLSPPLADELRSHPAARAAVRAALAPVVLAAAAATGDAEAQAWLAAMAVALLAGAGVLVRRRRRA
jgi:LPXTG-motif cell wall-anchored protein